MIKQAAINRFLAISYLYFQITEEPSEDVPAIEIQEWMNIINSVEDPSAYLPVAAADAAQCRVEADPHQLHHAV